MSKIASRLLDFLYPACCHLCERSLTHGRHLCSSCSDNLHYIEAPFCDICGESYDGAITEQFICPNCHRLDFDFDFARAAIHSEGAGRDLVHDFKYTRQIHLADELAQLMEAALSDGRFHPYIENGIIVPVPLYWLRQRKRRFNQAEEIGKKLSPRIGIPQISLLKRTRNTQTQTRLSRKKRLANLNQAFELKKKYIHTIEDKPIILIDDVFTTGSTANECAKVLKQQGAKSIAVLTVLRG